MTLTFTTRAPGDDPNLLKGEGMKHLRVIVADQQSGEVRFNYTHEFDQEETTHTVHFGDLYAGRTYDFYAIANEASFGGDFSSYAEHGDLGDENVLLNYSITTADPNTLITESLPAAGKARIAVQEAADQQLTITMQRAVAKAKVTFVNETGAAQTITNVRLVKVGAENTVLFPRTSGLPVATKDVPLGDVSVDAADGASGNVTGYFYESTAPTDGYALEATWNNNTKHFSLADDMEGGAAISSQILRNQMLNITITLKANPEEVDIQLLVEPWDEKTDITIPPFE
ncbi:MAG TPA: hypothetical protein DCZ73_05415 [Bacteroides sp.]|nr:hypothetical protein [Bacteroides sp.]